MVMHMVIYCMCHVTVLPPCLSVARHLICGLHGWWGGWGGALSGARRAASFLLQLSWGLARDLVGDVQAESESESESEPGVLHLTSFFYWQYRIGDICDKISIYIYFLELCACEAWSWR